MSSSAVSANADIRVTLPDGSVRTYAAGSTGADVAASIGAGLAKAALAIRLDGKLKDLGTPITRDARLEIVTMKDRNEAELLELLPRFLAKDARIRGVRFADRIADKRREYGAA